MMKIGISLAMDILCETPRTAQQQELLASGGIAGLLERLKAAGVSSIEMRTVRAGERMERIAQAAKAIWTAELTATVHSVLPSVEKVDLFFEQLKPVLALQNFCCVTVHPEKAHEDNAQNVADTVRSLNAVAQRLRQHQPLRVHVALENNRMHRADHAVCRPEGVAEVLCQVNEPMIGACFDFGHLLSDHRAFPEQVPEHMPSAAFVQRAIHTHIHAMGDGRTHFPLSEGELPLYDYVHVLKEAGYDGVYNLELEPERWTTLTGDLLDKYLRSIEILREELAQYEAPDREPGDYLHVFGTSAGMEPMPDRHHCSLAIEHAGQLYWFDAGECCAWTAANMGLDLQKIRAIFISHPHMDHIGGLGDLLWYVRKLDGLSHRRQGAPLSLFMPDDKAWPALKQLLEQTEGDFVCQYPIPVTRVKDGPVFAEAGLSVVAMHNLHLPQCADGTWRSYSYRMELDGKTIVFTGDVLNLAEIAPLLEGCDVLIAETGHHHPVKVVQHLNELGLCPKLWLIHHGRVIQECGESAVDAARAQYPNEIVVLRDAQSIRL